ncbi:hypothetical protein AVEN_206053-1 [Araneus ventricosus]|uniref:Uncharacterized protein n=1 Tax=Araneus ventricosus TaxID=182803 RepID=A0A4Y2VMG4_ARAVE|nr:hypothetical protein AVEN_206053-1 [Araneus ventricosus]
MTERFYNRQTLRFLNSREELFSSFSFAVTSGFIVSAQRSALRNVCLCLMSHDGRNMGKDTPRLSLMIGKIPRACGHRCAIGNDLLFAARVDIDVYDASGNIVHIAGKSDFLMLREKRQYKHRNGDYCVTSILSDASKIGTVLVGEDGLRLNSHQKLNFNVKA